jgi:hypothetical protein
MTKRRLMPTNRVESLITIAAIAKEYKLIPHEARRVLRAATLKKPAIGFWDFSPTSSGTQARAFVLPDFGDR